MNETGEKKNGMMKHYLVSAALVLVAVAATIGIMIYLQNSQAVATVNNEKITRNEFYDAMKLQGGEHLLEQMVANKLVLQEAKKLGIEVTEEEIDEEIDRYIQEELFGDEDYFYAMLEQRGIPIEFVRDDIRVELTARKLIKHKNTISEEEIKEYFENNRERFNIPDEFEARHILVGSEEKAREIINLLDEGEDFAALAAEHSTDTGTKTQGGNLGIFPRGAMVSAFQDAIDSLKVGERSGAVQTSFGYHVIELLDRKEGREVTFEEVKDDVENAIYDGMMGTLREILYASLFEDAHIKYH